MTPAKQLSPSYKATGDIIREKFVYPADDDEHVVPTKVNLACITQSNTNVLVTTPHISASYTATCLTLKEKSKIEITAGSSHEMLKVTIDGEARSMRTKEAIPVRRPTSGSTRACFLVVFRLHPHILQISTRVYDS